MLRKRFVPSFVAVLCAASLSLGACSDEVENAPESVTQSNDTLASVLSEIDGLETLSSAIGDSGLGSVFDGASAYTVLAPDDSVFEQLGERGTALLSEDQRPILVALLRDHIVPGALDLSDIRAAIEAKGGPVEMKTVGDSTLTFALDEDTLTVQGDGQPIAIASERAVIAGNGIALPINGLVSQPPDSDGDQ